jgi:hypothetical protein
VFVRTGYHTQVPEISGKLNGKKSAFTWATSFLLRSLSAEQLEPPSICSATVKRLMIRDHETTRANEQSALIVCKYKWVKLQVKLFYKGVLASYQTSK